MPQNSFTNKISAFIGFVLLFLVIVFTMIINKPQIKTVKELDEIEERKVKIESFKQRSDSINQALDSIATQQAKDREPLYPNIFDKIYQDTCIYDLAIYDNKKEKIIRYIPPYAGKICIKHIGKDKLIIKIQAGFDFEVYNSKNVVTVITDTLIKTPSEIIHKEVNILQSSMYDRMKKTRKERDYLTLTMKYLHLSFKNKKYIDSLINIEDRDNNNIPMIPYYKARSIIAFSSLTDTTKSKILDSQWSKIMYYAKRQVLKEQKINDLPKDTFMK